MSGSGNVTNSNTDATMSTTEKRSPSDFLKKILGRPVRMIMKLHLVHDYLIYDDLICESFSLGYSQIKQWYNFQRYISMPGWLHEYCDGADRRAC